MHPHAGALFGNINPISLRSCYDEGKRCAETLLFDYHRQHDIDIKVVRIFHTYGRMHAAGGRVVFNFIVQALLGEDITTNRDRSQNRSFCYAGDLVRGFLAFHGRRPDVHGPINLGDPNEVTIRELAEVVLAKVCER